MLKALKAEEISKAVGGQISPSTADILIQEVAIDSRNILQPDNALFVALRGAKFDGHAFIPSVFDLGVRTFLVSMDYEPSGELADATFIKVPNPLSGLQALAAFQRNLFSNPLIAITGSNGKTIIKEWLGQLLGQEYAVAKSPKSYNSQVGVPLSVFGINSYHKVAIMEAGVSRKGEMQTLAAILKPDLGIFTNIGTAHEEGFDSIEQKLAEKATLFNDVKLLIYRKDHQLIDNYLTANYSKTQLISWSGEVGADYILSVKKEVDRSKIIAVAPNMSVSTFIVPFTDEASLENIRHAITASFAVGLTAKTIQEGLRHLKAVDMRLTLKPGPNESLLIDDTYNNDLAGLKLALDFMAAQRPKRRKILIMSDLLQVGNISQVYSEIEKLLEFHQIDKLIGVGEDMPLHGWGGRFDRQFFPDTDALLEALEEQAFDNDLILITGARRFGFEAIVNRLQQRIHGTTLEINLNALTHNYNFYKSRIGKEIKVMVMVKAFAYGGGAIEIANHLQQLQADYLAVAYTDEGVALREQGIRLPIMVLNPVQESFFNLDKYQLEPVVYSPAFFRQLANYCRHHGIHIKAHLDLDTGMHRLGFEERHLEELKTLIQEHPYISIGSLYTHLVGADESVHEAFTREQLDKFLHMCTAIQKVIPYKPLRHALNSAGIIQYPEYHLDMIRLGIGLYGVEVSGKFDRQLKPISTLKTTISQIKELALGQTIGYGRKGVMPTDGQIATIAIGYADGYDRRFSNGNGYVLIGKYTAPVIGNVCMDMTMIDITGIPAKEGDEVIIYGSEIPLKELASRIGTIPYELLTNISGRVKRVYYLD
jgi:Alr-MurF fusion protein